MKKKFFLIVAMLVIAISACAMLVGCDDTNKPSEQEKEEITAPTNPAEFYKAWKGSSKMSITSEIAGSDSTTITISDNIVCMDMGENYTLYMEITASSVNSYVKTVVNGETNWQKTTKSIEDAKEDYGVEGDLKAIDLLAEMLSVVDKVFVDFDKNFTKVNDEYVANEDTDLAGKKVKINGVEMTLTYKVGENTTNNLFKIGGDSIVIPEEAKNAQ